MRMAHEVPFLNPPSTPLRAMVTWKKVRADNYTLRKNNMRMAHEVPFLNPPS